MSIETRVCGVSMCSSQFVHPLWFWGNGVETRFCKAYKGQRPKWSQENKELSCLKNIQKLSHSIQHKLFLRLRLVSNYWVSLIFQRIFSLSLNSAKELVISQGWSSWQKPTKSYLRPKPQNRRKNCSLDWFHWFVNQSSLFCMGKTW